MALGGITNYSHQADPHYSCISRSASAALSLTFLHYLLAHLSGVWGFCVSGVPYLRSVALGQVVQAWFAYPRLCDTKQGLSQTCSWGGDCIWHVCLPGLPGTRLVLISDLLTASPHVTVLGSSEM